MSLVRFVTFLQEGQQGSPQVAQTDWVLRPQVLQGTGVSFGEEAAEAARNPSLMASVSFVSTFSASKLVKITISASKNGCR